MNEKEVMLENIRSFQWAATCIISHCQDDALSWQPDPQTSLPAHTYWHICRSLDQLRTGLDQDRKIEDEIWFQFGWLEKTGFDPREVDWKGLGHLADYSPEENQLIPLLSRDELLSYKAQTTFSLKEYLGKIKLKELRQASGEGVLGGLSRNYAIWSHFTIGYEKLGQIRAILALYPGRSQ